MIPIASKLSQNPSAPLRVAANGEKSRRNELVVSSRVVPRPPTALVTAQPAVLSAPSDAIGRMIVRTFIVLLAIGGGIVCAMFLGLLLGFIRIDFC